MLGEPGVMLPRKNDKNGATWCNLCVLKYVITNIKINDLKDN